MYSTVDNKWTKQIKILHCLLEVILNGAHMRAHIVCSLKRSTVSAWREEGQMIKTPLYPCKARLLLGVELTEQCYFHHFDVVVDPLDVWQLFHWWFPIYNDCVLFDLPDTILQFCPRHPGSIAKLLDYLNM